MVMSFTITYCDIELEQYLQIPVNKYRKFAQGMLGFLEIIFLISFPIFLGGGPRVVVSTAAFHARVWGSVPGLNGLKETKCFFPIHV